VTDKLKRFVAIVVIFILLQLLLTGPSATATWWRTTADMADRAMDTISTFIDSVSGNAATVGG
jgi:hypothetical protein